MIRKLFNRFWDWIVRIAEGIHEARMKNPPNNRYY